MSGPRKRKPPELRQKLPVVVDMDRHVGARVRLRRMMLGISQEAVGDKLGLTFQQVQKYECGANRVSASRLYEIGQVLGVGVAFFYDDRDPVHAPPLVDPVRGDDPLVRPDSRELLQAYARLGARLQGHFTALLRALVAAAEEEAQAPLAPAKRRRRAAA